MYTSFVKRCVLRMEMRHTDVGYYLVLFFFRRDTTEFSGQTHCNTVGIVRDVSAVSKRPSDDFEFSNYIVTRPPYTLFVLIKRHLRHRSQMTVSLTKPTIAAITFCYRAAAFMKTYDKLHIYIHISLEQFGRTYTCRTLSSI